jgi:hypothetical protein
MRGSKAFASPATLTRSGTGGGEPGWNIVRRANIESNAIIIALIREVDDLVMPSNLLFMKQNAASNGSVRCCTSARTANRISSNS